jgi:hypothetical protein
VVSTLSASLPPPSSHAISTKKTKIGQNQSKQNLPPPVAQSLEREGFEIKIKIASNPTLLYYWWYLKKQEKAFCFACLLRYITYDGTFGVGTSVVRSELDVRKL